jgi:conjugative transposon TraM protein
MTKNMEPNINPDINSDINSDNQSENQPEINSGNKPDIKKEIKKIQHSEKFLRERKFMTMLPLIIIPFLVFIFIALKGGTAVENPGGAKDKNGINTSLPGPNLNKRKDKDKLGVYEEANKDSLKLHDQMKNDPYYNQPDFSKLQPMAGNPGHSTGSASADSNEAQVVRKLDLLKKVLNSKSAPGSSAKLISDGILRNSNTNKHKLQNMMEMISAQNTEPDPQVTQLNTMLDKVMLIQHPEKMQDSMMKLSAKNKTRTFVVTSASDASTENNITLMDTMDENVQLANAFYGLNDDGKTVTKKQNAIQAVIPESQTLVSGATVKLMLLDEIFVNGLKIPKNEPVYGTASLSGERLKISIGSIRYENNILPVSLEVYDLDGMAGVYIPGSINRDVGKQSADNAVSAIGINPVDESVTAQATLAGIEAAKTLASRKIKLVRVTIKSGYRVLLKNASQQ